MSNLYSIKGFMAIPQLSNNTFKKISKFGEISALAYTYASEHQTHAKPDAFPDVEAHLFKMVSPMGEIIVPPPAIVDQMLAVGQWVFNQYINGLIPSNPNKDAFIETLSAEFTSVREVYIGEILVGDQPNQLMPDYVVFYANDANKEYRIKLWFSNQAFEAQYDEFEVFVIPPVDVIDGLNNTLSNVQNQILSRNQASIINRINEIQKRNPYTTLESFEILWHDPKNATITLPTVWTLVIYGRAGGDTNVIKDKIRQYIAGHSGFENWNLIYPDLYAENEFVIMPLWRTMAVPENTYDAGLYRSTTPIGVLTGAAKTALPLGYSQSGSIATQMNKNLEVLSVAYRGMLALCIGNANNSNEVCRLSELYPDYMSISASSPDFGRLSLDTQAFCLKLNDAIEKARLFMPNDNLPLGFNKFISGEQLYLTFTLKGFNFLVQTKHTAFNPLG